MPDSPYVLESFTHINLEAAWFAEDAETKKQLLTAAGSSAERLGEPRFAHHALAHMIRALYFDTINNQAAALESCERLLQTQSLGWVRGNAAYIMYRNGRYKEALDVFRTGSDDSKERIMLGILEAIEEPSCAQSHFEGILKYASDMAKVNPSGDNIPPEIILFAGQQAELGKGASERRLGDRGLSSWEMAMLNFLAFGNESSLIESAQIPAQKSLAHFIIGRVHVSDGNADQRNGAIKSFAESERQTAYGMYSIWSRALRTRMESEPAWPIAQGDATSCYN